MPRVTARARMEQELLEALRLVADATPMAVEDWAAQRVYIDRMVQRLCAGSASRHAANVISRRAAG